MEADIQAKVDAAVKEYKELYGSVKSAPPWKLYIAGAIALLILIYMGWMIWDLKHPKGVAGSVNTSAELADELEDLETETTTTTTTYYPDKAKAETKLGIPVTNNAKELLVIGNEIDANKHGAKTAVYLNTSTAKYRTTIKYNEAPWFAFKRDLAVGLGGGVSTQGTAVAGRVRLDVLQIKEITITPEIEFNYAANRKTPVESRAIIWGEWRP